MMYIISDNAYFSLGLYESFEGNKEGVECVAFPFKNNSEKKLKKDDLILLVIDDVYLLDRFILSLPRNLVIVIFIGIPSFHFIESSLLPMKTGKSILCIDTLTISTVLKRIYSSNESMYGFYTLIDRERIIMNFLAKGFSVRRISSILNVSVDTISVCKNSSLRKLGLAGMNAKALFIYKIISITKKFAVCLYEPIIK